MLRLGVSAAIRLGLGLRLHLLCFYQAFCRQHFGGKIDTAYENCFKCIKVFALDIRKVCFCLCTCACMLGCLLVSGHNQAANLKISVSKAALLQKSCIENKNPQLISSKYLL